MGFNYLISTIILVNICIIAKVHCAPEEDLIKYLPGLKRVLNFKHYSGYLDGNEGDHLHYWFVESALNPLKDPVLLWMNGGPGCSSLDGLFNELGPYHIASDGKTLYMNDFSWNKIANVLFLEAPACVGFSYRNNGSCYTTDDNVSLSNYMALQSFFKKFPEYRKNPFFITGESYGGIYVPTLSVRVVEGNADFPINFQGFAVGNGLSSFETNDDSLVFFAYYHGLIGRELWGRLVKYCCKDGVESEQNCNFESSSDLNCQTAINDAMRIIYESGLNIYNLYADCVYPKKLNGTSRYYFDKHNLFLPLRKKLNEGRNPKKMFLQLKLDPPCTDSTNMRLYLNKKKVQLAIHVKPVDWDICSDEVSTHYHRQYESMRKQYEFLTKHVKGLIYNGDVDMACNFLGDEWFAESLGLKVVAERKMWHYSDQVAGFLKRFENLDVVTIRGAGHMVPQDKPGPSLKMISAFIKGKSY